MSWIHSFDYIVLKAFFLSLQCLHRHNGMDCVIRTIVMCDLCYGGFGVKWHFKKIIERWRQKSYLTKSASLDQFGTIGRNGSRVDSRKFLVSPFEIKVIL